MIFEESLTLNGRELNTILSFKSPIADMENHLLGKPIGTKKMCTSDDLSRTFSNLSEKSFHSPVPQNERDQAALKLQKVYKSFRTRRQLADCAVLAEQRWWKLLDFAELKRSSISFFDMEKPETALSRWSRARTRVAKIDPRHRYGHNLQFYYVKWLRCDSNQPFFYWLDIGEGKEVCHERCPRSKLQQQCIKYLGPAERKVYEVIIENRRLFYKESGEPIHTAGDAKWIFVLSTSKTLYIGQKNKGTFQHSSFLAGGATLSAVWPHSGHYLPTQENFEEFMSFLKAHNVNLADVKKSPREDEEDIAKMNKDILFRGDPSETELAENFETKSSSTLTQVLTDLRNENCNAEPNSDPPLSRLSRVGLKIARLEIPKRDNMFDIFGVKQAHPPNCNVPSPDLASECGYETAEESLIDEEDFMVPKSNLFVEDQEEEEQNHIPKENIVKRIDSHKGMKSYQLAYHLSTRWTTGAGPRIGCLRDYPPELQFRILEHQNLSPRTRTTAPSPRISSPLRFSPYNPPHSARGRL
ncbi:unnamed protein product [Lupinus luteus]|uniref:IQ domain-containing protein IQM6-like n=1 Tax=Lupinus luteus TaxID=3873 RepID=A0AAV1WKW9_LUPLU